MAVTIFQALLLSLVEGITEFLPISSTGHLILASQILDVAQTEFVKSFEIVIQFGAILAVVFLYRQRLVKDFEGWKKIITAFIPTAILGLILYKIVKSSLLGNSWVVVVSLFVGGILLVAIEKYFKSKERVKDFAKLSYKQSFLIGLGQSVSMIPGVSRSAATIITGMFLGMDRKSAAEFSFLLAVPTMAAATGLDLLKSRWAFSIDEYLLLTIGFVGAFFSALLAVKYFIEFVQKHTFVGFGIYRIVVALLFWLVFLR
ncbi:MAG: Undecaprenyl-diphosphatase [Microgenomates group bacterium GW2011_GWA1_48_10]|nr:MAG: Undecaprenyl-diphosphatase [Microgenomates group bacterium GW2011_GWA1_48_10]